MLRYLCNTLQRSSGALMARTQRYAQDASGKAQPPTGEVLNHADVPIVDYDYPEELKVPGYPKRENEPLDLRKARLVYQSRKRGMLENDLLLSTFASKYLKGMSPELTEQYDELINGVSNDWDIYYWATNTKTTPPEYDNEIMRMLKNHVENAQRELRLRQPDLH